MNMHIEHIVLKKYLIGNNFFSFVILQTKNVYEPESRVFM